MNILLTSATLFEIEPTVNWLRARAETEAGNVLNFGTVSVEVLFTGVGLTATAYALGARFGAGNHLEILNDASNVEFEASLDSVVGLSKLIDGLPFGKKDKILFSELAIHGLAELDVISKDFLDRSMEFSDPLSEMFDNFDDEDY